MQGFTELRGVWNEIYAVAVAVRAELAFEQYDSEAVIQFLGRTVADVRKMGARSLEAYVAALLVLYLVRVGRAGEAGQVWTDHGLPCDASALLDLDGQSWRRMEGSVGRPRHVAGGAGRPWSRRQTRGRRCAPRRRNAA